MSTPFLIDKRTFGPSAVHLLPNANVVLVIHGEVSGRGVSGRGVQLVLPHRTVTVMHDVTECANLSPNFVKCLIGEPRRHLGRKLTATEYPVLEPFAPICSVAEACELLHDLRNSQQVTAEERDFIDLWALHGAGRALPTSDRQMQRLCLRYAGQAPAAINAVSRLARTLDDDNSSGRYNGLGEYADASHFARACRSATGRTPAAWRNMSQSFYSGAHAHE